MRAACRRLRIAFRRTNARDSRSGQGTRNDGNGNILTGEGQGRRMTSRRSRSAHNGRASGTGLINYSATSSERRVGRRRRNEMGYAYRSNFGARIDLRVRRRRYGRNVMARALAHIDRDWNPRAF